MSTIVINTVEFEIDEEVWCLLDNLTKQNVELEERLHITGSALTELRDQYSGKIIRPWIDIVNEATNALREHNDSLYPVVTNDCRSK